MSGPGGQPVRSFHSTGTSLSSATSQPWLSSHDESYMLLWRDAALSVPEVPAPAAVREPGHRLEAQPDW